VRPGRYIQTKKLIFIGMRVVSVQFLQRKEGRRKRIKGRKIL
jgi:hypothetical protein